MDVSKVGGLMAVGHIGMLAVAGGWYGVVNSNADQQYDSVGESASLGATVGIATAGLGYTAYKLTDYATKNNFEHAKNGAKIVGKIGKAGLEATGEATIGAVKGSAKAIAGTTVGIGDSIAKTFFEVNKEKHDNLIGGVGLNKKGKFAAKLIGLGMIAAGMAQTEEDIYKGTPSGFATSTPIMDGPSMDNYTARQAETYGAGGDLVFALNNNRRG